METRYFKVARTEGEYAYLCDEETGEEVFVALALLPPGTDVGTRLRYAMLSYEQVD